MFTAPSDAGEVIGTLAAEFGLPITAIGTIGRGKRVRLLDANRKELPVEAAGYRHF